MITCHCSGEIFFTATDQIIEHNGGRVVQLLEPWSVDPRPRRLIRYDLFRSRGAERIKLQVQILIGDVTVTTGSIHVTPECVGAEECLPDRLVVAG